MLMIVTTLLVITSGLEISSVVEEKKDNLGFQHPINLLPDINNQPIFGVLTLPWEMNIQYIASSYVKYLEMSGARVVPISLNYSYKEIDFLLASVNGVFFTGGDAPFWSSHSQTAVLSPEYGEKGCYIYEQVKKFNDQGNFFPL